MDARDRLLTGLPIVDERIALAGVPSAVLTGGAGPPMVLLHGAGEFAAVWLRVIPTLARSHNVVVPDLPGHGATPATWDLLGWLDALVERTCAAPPVVVGHGLGGALATRLACEQPDRFAALVLTSTLGLDDFAPAPSFAAALWQFTKRPNERTRDNLFTQCFADLDRLRERMGEQWTALADYALETARRSDRHDIVAIMMSWFALTAIPTSDLDRIRIPTTLIWGRYDLRVLLRTAQTASARHGWPLHVIDNAGDDPALEQPDAFLHALYAALAGIDRQEALR